MELSRAPLDPSDIAVFRPSIVRCVHLLSISCSIDWRFFGCRMFICFNGPRVVCLLDCYLSGRSCLETVGISQRTIGDIWRQLETVGDSWRQWGTFGHWMETRGDCSHEFPHDSVSAEDTFWD